MWEFIIDNNIMIILPDNVEMLGKPAAQAQLSGKNNNVYKLISQPHKNLRHGKLKKTQLKVATNCSLHTWNHPAFRYQINTP